MLRRMRATVAHTAGPRDKVTSVCQHPTWPRTCCHPCPRAHSEDLDTRLLRARSTASRPKLLLTKHPTLFTIASATRAPSPSFSFGNCCRNVVARRQRRPLKYKRDGSQTQRRPRDKVTSVCQHPTWPSTWCHPCYHARGEHLDTAHDTWLASCNV